MHTAEITALITRAKAAFSIVQAFEQATVELKRKGKDFECLCPFHFENTPSCIVHPDTGRFKCFGCGKSGDVIEFFAMLYKFEFMDALKSVCAHGHIDFEVGTKMPVKLPAPVAKIQTAKPQQTEKPKQIYSLEKLKQVAEHWATGKDSKMTEWNEYVNPATGQIDLITIRIQGKEKKSFMQARPEGNGFVWGGIKDGLNPIFNRGQIKSANSVVVVEGEKCVRALVKFEIAATTSPGGANAGDKADWRPLAGKNLILWPDNDANGKNYMQTVRGILETLKPAPSILLIDPEPLKLGDGGDVADFIKNAAGDEHEKCAAVCEIIANAGEVGTVAEMQRDIGDAISGVRYNVPFPWPELTRGMRALIPGVVSILCGPPGDGKSLVLLQVLGHCLELNVSARLLACEDGAAYHLRRRLAQVAKESHLTDDEWCKDFPDKARLAMDEHSEYLKAFSSLLEAPPKGCQLLVADLLAWVKKTAEAGTRVLAIDPITAMQKGHHGFEDDRKFMMEAKAIIEEHKCSLLLVTHPPKVASGKGAAMQGMSDLAGGAAYERFSQSIWCFSAHEEKDKTLSGNGNPDRGKTVRFNRTIRVMKARNSWGKGKNFAFNFNLPSLSIEETGEVER